MATSGPRYRDSSLRPVRKLSIGLIKTYNYINKVYYARKRGEDIDQFQKKRKMEDTYPEELDSDPYVVNLYEEAIKKGQEIDKTIRVNVVGNYAQGKTSVVRRLTGQSLEGVESTNGVEVNRCKCSSSTEGKQCLSSVNGNSSRDFDVIERVISVVRLTENKGSSSTVDIQSPIVFGQQLPDASNDPSVGVKRPSECRLSPEREDAERDKIIGNKDENKNSKTGTSSSAESNAKRRKKMSLFTSEEMKTFSSILRFNQSNYELNETAFDLWDFGGQYIFYATHTMFHSRRAIYLLVFDLTATLDKVVRDEEFPWETGDKNMEYFTRFWMNSIHSFVGSDDGSLPPVYLIGTHYDKLSEEKRLSESEKYFEQVRSLFDDTKLINHIQPLDFRVNNKDSSDAEIVSLRNEIVRMGKELSRTSVIPVRWLPLERRLKQKNDKKIITLEEILEIDAENEFPIGDEEQVKLFLTYHHAKGTLFYFDEEPISNYIVLDPQYIIDAFKCIITSERFCKKEPHLRHLWHRLRKDARLERELISKVWSSCTDQTFIEHEHVLLAYLKRHYIISEASEFDEQTSTTVGIGWYVVPSLLKGHSTEEMLEKFLRGRRQSVVCFVMSFTNSPVVQIVYHRLLAALLGKWSPAHLPAKEKSVLLFENLGALRLNDCNIGLAEVRDGLIQLRVVSLCPSLDIDSEIADRFRRFSESVVTDEYKKMRKPSIKQEKPYIPSYKCNHESHGIYGSISTQDLTELEGKHIMPCPDLMGHEINAKRAKSEWFFENQIIRVELDIPLTAKQFGKIADAVGENWELLGLELGLTKVQIQQISMDNHTCSMKIYNMLLKWRDLKEDGATINALLTAMENVKTLSIDWDVIRNVVDKIKDKTDS